MLAILAVFSTPVIWNTFSLAGSSTANPQVPHRTARLPALPVLQAQPLRGMGKRLMRLKCSSNLNRWSVPQMQLIVIYCCLILLARNMANKPAALLCGQICLAAVLGAGLAIGVQAITLAANGGIWAENTATKVSQDRASRVGRSRGRVRSTEAAA